MGLTAKMHVDASITFVTLLMLYPDICGYKNIIDPHHVASKRLDDQVSHCSRPGFYISVNN